MRILHRGIKMTAAAYVERAQRWARKLEDEEAERSGVRLSIARDRVARRTLVPPGTLENLRKGRLKAIAAHVYDRLRAGVIAELESELRHVTHEIHIARQTGLDPASGEAHALLASRQEILEALGLDRSPPNGEGG